MKHFADVKASADERSKMMGMLFDAAGMVGPEGEEAKVVYQVALSAVKTAYDQAHDPSDYNAVAEQVRGAIELDMVTNKHYPPGWTREDALAAMRSMDAAIHANGQS
jgi:hypothetical protein